MKTSNASLVLCSLYFLMVQAHAADPVDIQTIDQTATDFHTANPATAPLSYEDEILISQIGVTNYARTEQFGTTDNYASVAQAGNANAAGVFQADGVGNDARIYQQGNSNYTAVTQSGSNNLAELNQYNDNNRFGLNQQGGNNSAIIDQYGNSSMTLNQTGNQAANISLQDSAQGTITQISPTLNLSVGP